MCVVNYLFNVLIASHHNSLSSSVTTIIGVTLPIAGWLANIRFGRYKVIRFSIWTMWITSVLLTIVYVVLSFIEFSPSSFLIHIALTISLAVVLAFGVGAFQAIIIQFRVDQLNDASTSEITLFVAWYAWTLTSSNVTTSSINMLTCIDLKYSLMGPLLIIVCLTVVVGTNFLFGNHPIKEPVTQNPFKLIYKVVKYAIKTKYPQQRSAFTYWEDEPP